MLGELDEAVRVGGPGPDRGPGFRRETGFVRSKSMSELIARWEKAVAVQPANELARFSLGKALFDAGRVGEAREHFAEALRRKPEWMVVQILLGRCHQALGDPDAAREAYRRAHVLAVEQHHEGPQAELEQLLADLG